MDLLNYTQKVSDERSAGQLVVTVPSVALLPKCFHFKVPHFLTKGKKNTDEKNRRKILMGQLNDKLVEIDSILFISPDIYDINVMGKVVDHIRNIQTMIWDNKMLSDICEEVREMNYYIVRNKYKIDSLKNENVAISKIFDLLNTTEILLINYHHKNKNLPSFSKKI